MRTVVRIIDCISEWTGRTVRWFCAILVAVMTFEVTMRYVFNAPTMWSFETATMIGVTIYVMAWTYTHRHHAHIRVDFFYGRLSLRGKAIVDVLGDLLLFFPLMILFIYTSIDWAWDAWSTGEVMIYSAWYPPTAPLRTVVAIGFCLFALQGGAQFVRDLYQLVRNTTYD